MGSRGGRGVAKGIDGRIVSADTLTYCEQLMVLYESLAI